jgi:hypothetical protein
MNNYQRILVAMRRITVDSNVNSSSKEDLVKQMKDLAWVVEDLAIHEGSLDEYRSVAFTDKTEDLAQKLGLDLVVARMEVKDEMSVNATKQNEIKTKYEIALANNVNVRTVERWISKGRFAAVGAKKVRDTGRLESVYTEVKTA